MYHYNSIHGFTDLFWIRLDEYLVKYCANSLTELEFLHRELSFEKLQITFPNIQKIQLTNCYLDDFITKFNERFPKMRSLELARGYY